MRLTVSTISSGNTQIIQLDVPRSISVADLKALISAEVPAIPSVAQNLYYNGRLLSDPSHTLDDFNMKEDDMVVVHHAPTASAGPSRQTAPPPQQQQQQQQQQQRVEGRGSQTEHDFEMIRLQVLGDPRLLQELRNSNPELAETVNDSVRFAEAFRDLERKKAEAEREKQREIQMLNEDPFNIEAQQKIEELIRQEAVMENLQSALEHHPEAFGRVTMLYIPVEVNGVAVKAFVDSGAQATIMSPSCAERCGIMRLVDSRFAGIARGVGTANILGRVHSAQIKIGRLFLACSFTVMEGKDVDLLLGLDMLKRHQATLDLKKGCLVIQDEEVSFLGESEIPKGFGGQEGEPTVEGPGGSRVSGLTGAIVEPPIRDIPQAQAQAQAQAQHGAGSSSSAFASQEHPDEVIQQLVGLGFSRAQAVAALNATNGDAELAASLLFN